MTAKRNVYMEFSIGGVKKGKLVFELFYDKAPISCQNFVALCSGEKGNSPSGIPLSYKGSEMHRLIKGFMIQGGSIAGGGPDELSMNGPTPIRDEFVLKHNARGTLAYANAGPRTTYSQFYITFKETHFLDHKHAVFGRLVDGFSLLDEFEKIPTNSADHPLSDIRIIDCGVVSDIKDTLKSMESGKLSAKEYLEAGLPLSFSKQTKSSNQSSVVSSLEKQVSSIIEEQVNSRSIYSTQNDSIRVDNKYNSDSQIENVDKIKASGGSTLLNSSDPSKPLSAMEEKLLALRMKINAGVKANSDAAAAEFAKNNRDPNAKKKHVSSDGTIVASVNKRKDEELSYEEQLARHAEVHAAQVRLDNDESRNVAEFNKPSTSTDDNEGNDNVSESSAPAPVPKKKDIILPSYLNEPIFVAEAKQMQEQEKQARVARSTGGNANSVEAIFASHERVAAKMMRKVDLERSTEQLSGFEGIDYADPTGVEVLSGSLSGVSAASIKNKKRSRKNAEDENSNNVGEIYANDRNRQYNKMLSKHMDAYTQDIKESLARGTAL